MSSSRAASGPSTPQQIHSQSQQAQISTPSQQPQQSQQLLQSQSQTHIPLVSEQFQFAPAVAQLLEALRRTDETASVDILRLVQTDDIYECGYMTVSCVVWLLTFGGYAIPCNTGTLVGFLHAYQVNGINARIASCRQALDAVSGAEYTQEQQAQLIAHFEAALARKR